MKYPDYETYQKLYGRYLKKGPERFFTKCDPKGKRVLDLCSGGGQLSQYALDHDAAFVQMVDMSYEMLNPNFKSPEGKVGRVTGAVEGFLRVGVKYYGTFDIVVCRQGVNYWFKNVTAEDIANVVNPGGMFVFNTFGNKPSETPKVREYFHGGMKYVEVSYLIGDKIHHFQTAPGIPPHFTVFDWIDKAEYVAKLVGHFDMEEVVDGPSSMWYCKRK